ncbi:MAG TPA: hypothetical protein VGM80_00645 [Gaiellaceae bacterium]|jgi:hypothetical protein
MWIRGAAGVLFILVGSLFVGQGTNLVPCSFMSGHPVYAGLGGAVVVAGLGLLRAAWRAHADRLT